MPSPTSKHHGGARELADGPGGSRDREATSSSEAVPTWRDQLGFYADCARYGDVVPVRLGPRRAVLFYHPHAIEDVLVTRSRDFVKSPGVRLLRPLLGEGLLLSEHDFWLRQPARQPHSTDSVSRMARP
jgi:hypothetical protein